jgi:hypothetical protein
MVWPACRLPVALIMQQHLITTMGDGVVCDLGSPDPTYCLTPKAQWMCTLPSIHALAQAVGVPTLMGCTPAPIIIRRYLVP